MYNYFMKIKCANCNKKTVSFIEGLKNRGHVNCPQCKSNLKLEPTRANRAIRFLNLILITYIALKTETGSIHSYLGLLIVLALFLLTSFYTTKTSISNHSITKKEVRKNSNKNLITIAIVCSIILYSWVLRNPNLNKNSPIMIIWGILSILGPIYLVYRVNKENKK